MIEDDPELAGIITRYLSSFDIKVTNAEDPYIGLSLLEMQKFDLLVLDLTLPGIDGLELIPKIREKSNIPIIISSARDDIVDKVIGLERGADDYMPKPYNPRELEARIKSILRRRVTKEEVQEKKSLFSVDENAMQISFKDHPLTLTPAEFDILSLLIKNKNAAVPRERFIYESEYIDDDSSSKSIDVMVSRIRQKLNKINPDFIYIKPVRNIGYRLSES